MKYNGDRVRTVVRDAIRRFFREEQHFNAKVSIDAVIGVTVDDAGMFYVSLNEVVDKGTLSQDPGGARFNAQGIPSRKRAWHKMEASGSLLMECSVGATLEKKHVKGTLGSRQSTSVSTPPSGDTATKSESDAVSEQGSDSVDEEEIVVKQELDDSWCENEQEDVDDSLSSNYRQFSDYPEKSDAGTSLGNTDLWSQESRMFDRSVNKSKGDNNDDDSVSGEMVTPPSGEMTQPAASTSSVTALSFPEGYTGPLPFLPHTISPLKEQRRHRSILPLIKKVELIQMSDGMSHRKLAEIFDISKTQVQGILKRREEILLACADSANHSKKLIADRQCKMQDVNMMTWTWCKDMIASNLPVSGPHIQRQAIYFAQLLGKSEFKASNGWLQSFKQRYKIVGSGIHGNSGSSKSDCQKKLPSQMGIGDPGMTKVDFSSFMKTDAFPLHPSVPELGSGIPVTGTSDSSAVRTEQNSKVSISVEEDKIDNTGSMGVPYRREGASSAENLQCDEEAATSKRSEASKLLDNTANMETDSDNMPAEGVDKSVEDSPVNVAIADHQSTEQTKNSTEKDPSSSAHSHQNPVESNQPPVDSNISPNIHAPVIQASTSLASQVASNTMNTGHLLVPDHQPRNTCTMPSFAGDTGFPSVPYDYGPPMSQFQSPFNAGIYGGFLPGGGMMPGYPPHLGAGVDNMRTSMAASSSAYNRNFTNNGSVGHVYSSEAQSAEQFVRQVAPVNVQAHTPNVSQ